MICVKIFQIRYKISKKNTVSKNKKNWNCAFISTGNTLNSTSKFSRKGLRKG